MKKEFDGTIGAKGNMKIWKWKTGAQIINFLFVIVVDNIIKKL